ncbi:endonuclease/exonuclease/phosphatase family protein [Brucellaceae bacterium C25G]
MRKILNPNKLSDSILSAIRNRSIYQPFEPRHAPNHTVIASYNVHKCVGTDKQFAPERIADVISEINADVIALQEADKRFGERTGLLDLGSLYQKSGLVPVPITSFSESGHGWHGNLLLFREGLVRDVRQLSLPGVEPRGALMVDLELANGPLRIIAAHLGLLKKSRAQQAEVILSTMANSEFLPTLMIGDLNEWRVGKKSSLNALNPVFNPNSGVVPSFPSRFPFLALDRIMAAPHNLITNIEVHDSPLARVASDHLPIKAHIDLQAALEELQLTKDKATPAK